MPWFCERNLGLLPVLGHVQPAGEHVAEDGVSCLKGDSQSIRVAEALGKFSSSQNLSLLLVRMRLTL